MTWLVTSVDTTTGERIDTLPVSAFSWDRALSAGAVGSCDIPLEGIGYSKTQLRYLTEHWNRTIVLENVDDDVVFAGLVRRRRNDGSVLRLELTDLWGFWARRGAWDQFAPEVEKWSETYTGTTLGTLAKRAVQRGLNGGASPVTDMPVTLPADASGSVTKTYYGYHLEYVWDVLDDLMTEGLNVDFRPRWVSGAFDWQMRNNPAANTWEWNPSAPQGGVSGFESDEDGTRMANHSIMVGEGSEETMKIQSNRDFDTTFPLLSRIDARKHIRDELQLDRMATGNLGVYEEPTDTWTFKVLANGTPSIGDIRLGDTARLHFDGHPWVEDGYHNRRIVRLSGSLGEEVTVACQPTGGG